MSSNVDLAQSPKITKISVFHMETRKLFREVWSKGGVPMDSALNNILSTTLSTREFIDTLRNFEPITDGLLMLLSRVESLITHFKNIESNEKPYPPWLTDAVRCIFNHLAEGLFKKMYKEVAAAEKEWCIIEEDKFDEEDFVFV